MITFIRIIGFIRSIGLVYLIGSIKLIGFIELYQIYWIISDYMITSHDMTDWLTDMDLILQVNSVVILAIWKRISRNMVLGDASASKNPNESSLIWYINVIGGFSYQIKIIEMYVCRLMRRWRPASNSERLSPAGNLSLENRRKLINVKMSRYLGNSEDTIVF